MMATGSPRCGLFASRAKPSTCGVPPRTSTCSTPTSAVSATPMTRPANHCFEPENLTAIASGRRSPVSPTSRCLLVTSVPCEATLARGRRVELGTQPRDRVHVAARARRGELAPQPRYLGVRLAQRVLDALQLGLEAREQALGFLVQTVGAGLEPGELAGVARGRPLAPPEPRDH